MEQDMSGCPKKTMGLSLKEDVKSLGLSQEHAQRINGEGNSVFSVYLPIECLA